LKLILLAKELWRHKVLLVLSVVAAIAIPLVVVFNVSPSGISKRNHVDAQGSIEILVDSARSPIADARRDLSGLTTRAGVFARLIAGGNVVSQIAKDSGIPVEQIDVAGPTPFPGEAPGVDQEPLQIHPYGIAITQPEELPIVKVVTRAPTIDEARALAAAAPRAVREVVESVQTQQDTPADKRIEFRVLGPARAAITDEALGKKAALALFFVILAMCFSLILGVPRLVAAWRAADPDDAPSGPETEREGAPEVLHLAGRGDDAESDDAEATWIGRRQEP
jgi:hypothetical protein